MGWGTTLRKIISWFFQQFRYIVYVYTVHAPACDIARVCILQQHKLFRLRGHVTSHMREGLTWTLKVSLIHTHMYMYA